MARSLFSPSWHSVAELRPRLVPQALVHRHLYRGQVWFVVQDRAGGRFHRLSPAAHELVAAMDGTRTVQSLWEAANAHSPGDACTQNEIVELLVQLHAANLLQCDVTPDSAVLFDRYRKKRRETLRQWLLNPMSLKLPLVDPDALLERWTPRLAWCAGPVGAALWLIVVLPALALAAQHWNELTHSLPERVLSSSNLLVMLLVFPVVKLLHELGHGFAAKAWGGAVHEMGIMFLVFAPVPYVDASCASAFPQKQRRAVVGAAGMLVEVFLAALALYVWLLTEPGVVRAAAFNVMLVAGISTLVVNGNPLLRYDGYFILTDLLEMPNLAQRGQKYLAALCDRYVFGAHEVEFEPQSAAERCWLLLYTPLAWCYRMFITLVIIVFVAGQFFVFGALLALWGAVALVCLPCWKAWRHVISSPTLERARKRAVRVSAALAALVLLVAFALPLPLRTRADGVVWLPDQAIVYAGGNGFFQRWLAQPGSAVAKGTPLYVLEDAQLRAELNVGRARLAETQARHRAEQFRNPAKAALYARQLEHDREALRRIEERAARLAGYAEANGTLIVASPQDMPGRHFKKGELLGYVLEPRNLVARVVVAQDDIDLVRTRWKSAELRLAEALMQPRPAALVRQVPAAVEELPSAALGLYGGGMTPTMPGDANGTRTLERVFLVDLELPRDVAVPAFGQRVHVRFDHGSEPLALQCMRRLRQLFLSHFGV
jgi:putative peptide zinc metalloprotease protein